MKDFLKNTLLLNGHLKKDVNTAIELLKNYEIVALPTETVYGLAGNGLSEIAIKKIFAAKNRPLNNPIILHVKDIKDAFKIYGDLNLIEENRIKKLAKNFWPGPLTIIAKKSSMVPVLATGGLNTVAVRVPNSKITLNILSKLDFPLAMPSANLSSRPSPTSLQHVLLTLNGLIGAVLDGGYSQVGIESTVVNVMSTPVSILRPGMVSLLEIKDILKEEVLNDFILKKESIPKSPGQAYLHYSPKVKSISLIDEKDAKKFWSMNNSMILTLSQEQNLKALYGQRSKNLITYVLPDKAKDYAKELYNAFYACEKNPKNPLIIINPPANDLSWQGVMDRIKKAANIY